MKTLQISCDIPAQSILVTCKNLVNLVYIGGLCIGNRFSFVVVIWIRMLIVAHYGLWFVFSWFWHTFIGLAFFFRELTDSQTYSFPECIYEILHPMYVPVESLDRNFPATLNIIDAERKSHCRYRGLILHLSLVSCQATEGYTSEKHSFEREGFFVDSSGQCGIHFNNLEFVRSAYMREAFKDLAWGQSEWHI